MGLLQAERFSMVRPSMFSIATLPLLTWSSSMNRSTRLASLAMNGPMPSPPMIPILMGLIFP
jgi:hypothetical protein